MAKGLTYFISLVIAVSICGCSTLPPKKNTRDFPLLYNNYLIKDYNKELDGNFIAYAKECAYGIPESGIKLAKLYQTTLDKNNPNYLYYQQEKFAEIYKIYDKYDCLSLIYRWCENNNYKVDWKNEIIQL